MILILLTFITLIFVALNLYLTKYDYMHPSVVFCFIFFICEIMCIIFKSTYVIALHWQTLAIICSGFIIFTILTYLFKLNYQQNIQIKNQLQYIKIPNILLVLLILVQVLTILFFISYLKDIYYTYTGDNCFKLRESIKLFDDFLKFNVDAFISLNVFKPMMLRLFYPISWTLGFVCLYIMVNNFIVSKKINFFYIIITLNLGIFSIIMGSRFLLVNIIVFIYIVYYMLSYRNGIIKKYDFKSILNLIIVSVLTILLMFVALYFIGRLNTCNNIFRYLFVYVGAEIANLDYFLTSNTISLFSGFSDLFAQQTFHSLYGYINKFLNISMLHYSNMDIFVYSDNNLFMGNVYTTYYKFIYDFGYLGVILILPIALYYIITYSRCKTIKNKVFDYELFIFAYLFTDLIFLFFTNRFYNTITDQLFLKLIVILICIHIITKYVLGIKNRFK